MASPELLMEEVSAALAEISASMADILELLAKPKPAEDCAPMAAAMAQAFRAAMADMKPPVVNLAAPTVPAPVINMAAQPAQAAPSVTVAPTLMSPAGAKWDVEMKTNSLGRVTGFVITKL